eukprot:gnl/TRDRNA2_/TRDRNA2_93821_c0_seq1.p1 gnl/TRDRNA2_/TRDRNA2_93821_c0~~gnl/TRDRNA2_/TRDRNA2_93821_c0_seq1.p1  ORF type:complete len:528 (-),score=83.97 gnl/TRDRNA2_/TRDRNA2_93821_c0_seq1:62-1645(-)
MAVQAMQPAELPAARRSERRRSLRQALLGHQNQLRSSRSSLVGDADDVSQHLAPAEASAPAELSEQAEAEADDLPAAVEMRDSRLSGTSLSKPLAEPIRWQATVSPPVLTSGGGAYGPMIALKMLPSPEATAMSHPAGAQASLPHLSKIPASAQAYPSYQKVWNPVATALPPEAPCARIGLSYTDVCRQRLGHTSVEQASYQRVEDFKRSLSAGYVEYSTLSQRLPAQQHRPQYGSMIAPLRPPVSDRPTGRPALSDVESLAAALRENIGIREALQRDVEKVQQAAPKPRPAGASSGYGTTVAVAAPTEEPLPYLLRLQIEVLKATGLPNTDLLGGCDPYTVVTVVDGDPLCSEAAAGGREWYARREQFRAETAVAPGTLEPEWRAHFQAEVRPRAETYCHFRVYDRDQVAFVDEPVGEVAIQLAEVRRGDWANYRPLALGAFAGQEGRHDLLNARLIVNIDAEEIAGQQIKQEHLRRFEVASPTRRGRGDSSSPRQRRARGEINNLSAVPEGTAPRRKLLPRDFGK